MKHKPVAPPHARQMLEAVRGLLLPDGVWIKGHHCTNRYGSPVGPWDSRACKFSLEGALLRVGHITRQPVGGVYSVLLYAISPTSTTSVSNWNDAQQTTHGAVIELLNSCIVQLGGTRYVPEPEGD